MDGKGARLSLRFPIVLFALSAAILNSALLPLWEGFDEPFHHSYLTSLACTGAFPRMRETTLTSDVARSLELAPASAAVKQNLPFVTTYDKYFQLTAAERSASRQELEGLKQTCAPSQNLNYEAHQAPLAYLALLPALLSSSSLTASVLAERLSGAILCVLLTIPAVIRLARAAELRSPYVAAALFCTFSSQMYWATVARVSNDWLAVPLVMWTFALFADLARAETRTAVIALTVVLTAGLLTKGYFIPLFIAVVVFAGLRRFRSTLSLTLIPVLTSSWWYGRNIILYRSLTGMQESLEGIGPLQVAHAALTIPWGKHVIHMARASFWTGNNSFTSLSTATTILALGVLAFGLALAVKTRERDKPSEGAIWFLLFTFMAALAWSTANSFAHSGGRTVGASPWYMQGLLAPVLVLFSLGAQRSARYGRITPISLVAIWSYVFLDTWFAKLIPLYGGFTGRASLARLLSWWFRDTGSWTTLLSTTALGSLWLVWISLALASVTCIVCAALLITRILREPAAMPRA